VSRDLAGIAQTAPGRFIPHELGGELNEVEGLARYAWASSFASNRRVLDAGCGLGHGISTLLDAGAALVVGVDIGEAIVETALARVPSGTDIQVADLHNLPFDDGAFDLGVCLETLSDVSDATRVLDELRRVIVADGLVAVSFPAERADLEEALRARWSEVRVLIQHDVVATTLLEDAILADGPFDPITLRSGAYEPRSEAVRRLALVGNRALPRTPNLVMLGSAFDVRQWLDRYRAQQRVLEEQADYLTEVQRGLDDRADLRARLAELETALENRDVLQAELETADNSRKRLAEEVGKRAEEIAELRERVAWADRVVRDMQGSLSWRLTRPLRAVKRIVRRK
jgi:SAM-dependent methyltransferase